MPDQRKSVMGWVSFTIWNLVILGGLAVALFFVQQKLPSLINISAPKQLWILVLTDLPREAGTACLVALFLSFSVEYFNQRHHSAQAEFVRRELDEQRAKLREQMNQDLLYAIYKRRVPAEIFEQVETQLLRADFVRREHRITLTFHRKKTDSGERVKIIIQHDYKVLNITDTPRDFAVGATIQTDPRNASALSQEFRFRSLSATSYRADGSQHGDSIRLNAEAIAKCVEGNTQNMAQTFRRPVSIVPEGYLSASVCYEGVHPLDGADVVSCMLPADRLTVTTFVPNDDFDVVVTSMHPTDAALTEGDGDFSKKTWEISRAIFPGQGISYQWYPRSPDLVTQADVLGSKKDVQTNGAAHAA
jgi:hypothetical protein